MGTDIGKIERTTQAVVLGIGILVEIGTGRPWRTAQSVTPYEADLLAAELRSAAQQARQAREAKERLSDGELHTLAEAYGPNGMCADARGYRALRELQQLRAG